MTRAEQLRAAATRMREAGSAATPGPWRVVKRYSRKHPDVIAQVEIHKPGRARMVSTKVPGEVPDAEWDALTHPGLAGPLPDLLDTAADLLDAQPTLDGQHPDGTPCDDLACRVVTAALTIADIIGGEA